MLETQKRLPVWTLPLQWCFKSVPKLVGVVPSMPPTPICVAQLVILNCVGLEIITVGKMGTTEVFVKDEANWS